MALNQDEAATLRVGAPSLGARGHGQHAASTSAGTEVGMGSRNRVRGLDELRGLSILWVMVGHGTVLWTWMPQAFAGSGFHGVVLFFIISGYLITRILMDHRGDPDYFGRFYANRFFRIWPLMVAVLVISAVIHPATAKYVVFNLLMVNNYAYAWDIEPMFRTDVMWSLAVEEQFYMLWPAVVALLAGRHLKLAAASLVLLGLLFDSGLLPGGPGVISKTTHGTLHYIAMGALIATGREGVRWILAAWAAFVALWLARKGVHAIGDFRYVWHGVSLVLALIVHGTVHGRLALRNRFLAEAGKLCYGLYLIHFFITVATLEYAGRGVFWPGAVYLAVSFALAIFSFRYFEMPMMAWRPAFYTSGNPRTLLILGLMFTVLASLVGMMNLLIFGPR
jgi:peptidoglycan/LPS O-acetylase OafA/YrhL